MKKDKTMQNNIMGFCYLGLQNSYDKIVLKYIEYYHMRAQKCKNRYYLCNTIKLIAIASVPVLQAIGVTQKYSWCIALMSAITLFTESIMGMTRFNEKWVSYRDTCNRLMSIQRQNAIVCGNVLNGQEKQYIDEVESLVGEEARNWIKAVQKQERSDEENKN